MSLFLLLLFQELGLLDLLGGLGFLGLDLLVLSECLFLLVGLLFGDIFGVGFLGMLDLLLNFQLSGLLWGETWAGRVGLGLRLHVEVVDLGHEVVARVLWLLVVSWSWLNPHLS